MLHLYKKMSLKLPEKLLQMNLKLRINQARVLPLFYSELFYLFLSLLCQRPKYLYLFIDLFFVLYSFSWSWCHSFFRSSNSHSLRCFVLVGAALTSSFSSIYNLKNTWLLSEGGVHAVSVMKHSRPFQRASNSPVLRVNETFLKRGQKKSDRL